MTNLFVTDNCHAIATWCIPPLMLGFMPPWKSSMGQRDVDASPTSSLNRISSPAAREENFSIVLTGRDQDSSDVGHNISVLHDTESQKQNGLLSMSER